MKPSVRVIPPEYDEARMIERPDGFYWQSRADDREFGPFRTLLEAIEDMQRADESTYEPGETVEQAEEEIGMANWIDPDTGEPAEESVPRIEDH